MSWSTSFKQPVRKVDAEAYIERLNPNTTDGPMIEQCDLAKKAAKFLVRSMPGPYIMVALSGHANGTGWHKKEGWSNDSVVINVSQICEEDLNYYPVPQATLGEGQSPP